VPKATKAAQYHTWWYAKTKFDKESEKWVLNKDKLEIDIIEFLDWLYLEGYRYTKIYDNGIWISNAGIAVSILVLAFLIGIAFVKGVGESTK